MYVSLQVVVDGVFIFSPILGLKEYDKDLAEVATDASKFASAFAKAIAAAATHIYLSALSFCPSESWMARIYGPQFRNILSVTSGRRINWRTAPTTHGHRRAVTSVAFFPDGRKLVSGSSDNTVCIWDSETGKMISVLSEYISLAWSIAVAPDGKLITSGSGDGTLRMWDSKTGDCPLGPIAAHRREIRSVAFSPDGSRIVTGSVDCTVKVWSTATGELCLGPLPGQTSPVISVAFSPDGTYLASGSLDGVVRLWDASTGESGGEPLNGHADSVDCVTFSANGHYLASGSVDRTIRLWDVSQGFAQVANTTLRSEVWSISFSPDSNCVVSGCGDGDTPRLEYRFWKLQTVC